MAAPPAETILRGSKTLPGLRGPRPDRCPLSFACSHPPRGRCDASSRSVKNIQLLATVTSSAALPSESDSAHGVSAARAAARRGRPGAGPGARRSASLTWGCPRGGGRPLSFRVNHQSVTAVLQLLELRIIICFGGGRLLACMDHPPTPSLSPSAHKSILFWENDGDSDRPAPGSKGGRGSPGLRV